MSRDTYHALIAKHFQRNISAHVAMIGEKACSPRYTTSGFFQMANLTIPPFVSIRLTSRVFVSSTTESISMEVV